jgi:hypothetical protein
MLLKRLTWLVIIWCNAARSQNAKMNTSIEEEMQMFLADNGFKYITMVDNATRPSETKSKIIRTISKRRTSYIRSLPINDYQEKYTFRHLDSHIFIMNVNNDEITIYLHMITQAPVQSSVICIKSLWGESEKNKLKSALGDFKLDSLFYLAVSLENNIKWYQIITLKSGFAITELKFSLTSFQIIEVYDLNGLTIYSISLSWSPYLTIKDCNQVGKNCTNYGYLKDYTDVIAKKLNFTYESQIDVNKDWGTLPKSGPHNCSGKWGGVMGGIINAKYDMSLSAWVWMTERSEIMSLVTIITTNNVIVWTQTNQEIDYCLFVRPFSPASWVAILLMTIIATTCIFITQYVIPNADCTNAQHIMVTTLFIFYVLLSAYHGGAMTMFFTSSTHNIFEDVVDVIRAYPEWKFMFLSGYESDFALKATFDPDYANVIGCVTV